MKTHTTQKLLALAALASLAACSGGGSTVPEPAQPTTGPAALTAKIVGVGDSLTAGYQAGGFLGQFLPGPVPNPNAGAPVPIVPPGQESGWWSLLYEQATGSNWLAQANPATSVLPLIAGTGLGNQLITTGPGSPLPFASLKNPGCQLEDQAGFSATQWTATRQNPNTTPLDVAVPGITMHEAVAMNQPLAPTCATIPNIPPSLAGLITVVNGESALFNPVLGNFESLGQNRTMLSAAVSLKPTLATV
ncbi:MAG TPA: hypothetical protein VGN11_04510, partial [Candidatus Baltobacteraceae bacterium]|nr:hypothetical protein [Candidatus Baltobacteraceae bacterium]